MGVYIPNMNKPASCGDCPCAIYDNFGMGYYCAVGRDPESYLVWVDDYFEKQNPSCPLQSDEEIVQQFAPSIVAGAIKFSNDRTK